MPQPRRRKRVGASTAPDTATADAPNRGWAVDFQFDSTTDGRPVKIVSIVDEHTREGHGGLVERSPTSPTGFRSIASAGRAGSTSVVTTCYLLGVSTRRGDKLVASLGIYVAVEVAGLRHGEGPRRPRGAVPDPAGGRGGSVDLRGRRRVGVEGP